MKKVYVFHRAGYDLILGHSHLPAEGTLVVKMQPFGCPKNGLMGHCFIGDALTGKFICLVDVRSLTLYKKGK